MPTARCALCALAVASLATGLRSQSSWSPTTELLDSYPRMIGVTVAVDASAANGALIYDGAGGDVYRLRHHTAATPPLELYDPGGPHVLDTGGVAMDIALTDDFVYVASFRNGLQVFRRPGDLPVCAASAPCWSAPDGNDVLSVSAVDVGAVRVLAVGTEQREETPTGGSLFLIEHDRAASNLRTLGEWKLGGPGYAIAASTAFPYRPLQTGANLTVLAGSGCGGIGGVPGGLQRRDFAVVPSGSSSAALQVMRQSWTARKAGTPKDIVVRDIVIDPERPRAYVAAHWDGVYAFDLNPARMSHSPAAPGQVLWGLARDQDPGWPLKLPNGANWTCGGSTPHVLGYARALALGVDGPARRLFVGLGPSSNQPWNIQYLGNTQPTGCHAGQGPAEFSACNESAPTGVYAWHLGSSDDPLPGASGDFSPDAWFEQDLAPHALAVRPDPLVPERWYVFVSNGTDGLVALEESPAAGPTGMVEVGDWNGSAPAKMPMPAVDDALVMKASVPGGAAVDVLYAAHESGLSVFDLSDPEPLRAPSTGQHAKNPTVPFRVSKGAILITGFGNPNGRIFASTSRGRPTTPGGIQFYDIADPLRPAAAGALQLHREGYGYGLVAHAGLHDPAKPPAMQQRRRYLYSLQEYKPVAGVSVEQWSVRLFDVGTEESPIDPCPPPPGQAQTPCNTCVPCLATFVSAAVDQRELSGLAVVEGAPDRHYVYALYSPRPPLAGEPSAPVGDRGLLALEARLGPGGSVTLLPVPASSPAANSSGFFRAFAGPATFESRASLVTVDAPSGRLFAAWTGGVALYDISTPRRPTLVATRDTGQGNYGLTRSAVRLAAGPQIGGRSHVYIAFLNDGIGVLDASDASSFASAPIKYLPMRWQTTFAIPDQRDPTRRELFVGSGTAGLDHVSFH